MLDEMRGYCMMFLHTLVVTRVLRTIIVSTLIIAISSILFSSVVKYVNGPKPTISVITPQIEANTTKSQMLVKGKVLPVDSLIAINGQPVNTNGDGTFSQVITLSPGINIFKIEASYFGKKSSLVQTATKVLTEQEKAEHIARLLIEEERIKNNTPQVTLAKKEGNILGIETIVSKSPTTATASAETYSIPEQGMIVSQKKTKRGIEKSITGLIKNIIMQDITEIKIKALYKSDNGDILGTKIGTVNLSGTKLKPGEEVTYTIPEIASRYSSVQLLVAYQTSE